MSTAEKSIPNLKIQGSNFFELLAQSSKIPIWFNLEFLEASHKQKDTRCRSSVAPFLFIVLFSLISSLVGSFALWGPGLKRH